VLPSISAYYHSDARYLFVCALFAVAVLLWAYPGYDCQDDFISNLASVATLGVVVFPTARPGGAGPIEGLAGGLHFTAAAVMFGALAVFCLVLFRRTKPVAKAGEPAEEEPCRLKDLFEGTRKQERLKAEDDTATRKKNRNRVYVVCGYTILAGMAIIATAGLFRLLTGNDLLPGVPLTFVCETSGLVAFGTSWVVKGEVILADDRRGRDAKLKAALVEKTRAGV
jgi:hypothetical protein